eukprot:scaffold42124_cov33-Prasinocladus_malaysianus.AAC.1
MARHKSLVLGNVGTTEKETRVDAASDSFTSEIGTTLATSESITIFSQLVFLLRLDAIASCINTYNIT